MAARFVIPAALLGRNPGVGLSMDPGQKPAGVTGLGGFLDTL